MVSSPAELREVVALDATEWRAWYIMNASGSQLPQTAPFAEQVDA